MIAAFVNDLKIMDSGDGNLYVRGYDKSFWNRYLRYFDKLYVVGRRFKVSQIEISGMDIFGNEKIELFEVPSIHSMPTLLKNTYTLDLALEELVRKVDCIITRQPSTNSGKVIKICRRINKPYIVEVAGCPWDALWNHSFRGKLLAPYSYLKTKKNIREAKYVIYVTNYFLQKRYPTKGRCIGCSDVVMLSMEKSVLEKRLQHISEYENKSQLHIVTVGAVGIKYKGHQYMIQALAKLKRDGKTNIQYHIVGNGNPKKLERLVERLQVSDQVIFHGSMKHDDIFALLDKMDLYIQPSDTEGLPRSLIEAMSRGLPCLGTNVGGIPELLDAEFLFSKRGTRINEIVNLINKFSIEVMKKQAERNFNKALEFECDVTDAKRKKIFELFLKSI